MRFLLALTITLVVTAVAQAERYATVRPNGKPVVAHTRLAPVVAHRLLPPYGMGIHVYGPRPVGGYETMARPAQLQNWPVQ